MQHDAHHGAWTRTILGLLLVVDALLHGVVVGRFGVTGNGPPALLRVV